MMASMKKTEIFFKKCMGNKCTYIPVTAIIEKSKQIKLVVKNTFVKTVYK